MTSRLSTDALAQLTPILGSLARMVARGSSLGEAELHTLPLYPNERRSPYLNFANALSISGRSSIPTLSKIASKSSNAPPPPRKSQNSSAT